MALGARFMTCQREGVGVRPEASGSNVIPRRARPGLAGIRPRSEASEILRGARASCNPHSQDRSPYAGCGDLIHPENARKSG